MVWGGSAVAVAAMVGYESAAASVGRLRADSINLLGHKTSVVSSPPHNRLDAAFPRQAAFEPIDFISFLAGSALFCVAKGGNTRGTNAQWIVEKNLQARRCYIIPARDPIGHHPGRFNGRALASLKRLETAGMVPDRIARGDNV